MAPAPRTTASSSRGTNDQRPYGVKRAHRRARRRQRAGAGGLRGDWPRTRRSNDVDSYTAFSTSFAPYERDVGARAASSGHAGGGGDARNMERGDVAAPGHGAHGTTEVRCDECSRDDEAGAATAGTPAPRGASGRRRSRHRRDAAMGPPGGAGSVAGGGRQGCDHVPAGGDEPLFHGETRTTTDESVWDARLACAHDRAPSQTWTRSWRPSPRRPARLAGADGCTFHSGEPLMKTQGRGFLQLARSSRSGWHGVKKRKGFEWYDSRLTQFSG